MNTQSHILIAATLFAKPGKNNRSRNIAAIAGGLLPDLAIFVMFFWSKFTGVPEAIVWREWYFSPFWQFWIDIFNSAPLFLVVLAAGAILSKWGAKFSELGLVLVIFSLSAIAHLIGDFFLHVEDAHAHFWPLHSWRFASPVSYWNPQYYGNYAAAIEAIAGIIMAIALFRRSEAKWLRIVLVLSVAAYIAVPAYFILGLGIGH